MKEFANHVNDKGYASDDQGRKRQNIASRPGVHGCRDMSIGW